MGNEPPRRNDASPFRGLIERPETALEEIYARYQGMLRHTVRKMVRIDEDLIDDVVSETLTVIWKRREEVAELDKPEYWMLQVAYRIALTKFRTDQRHPRVPLEEAMEISSEEEDEDGEQSRSSELMEKILEATEVLTPSEREIFMQAKFEGLDHDELMAKYGLARQTVKNKLSGAMAKIRERLRDILGAFIM